MAKKTPKKKQAASNRTLPFIGAAVICERAIEDKENKLFTLLNIYDLIGIQAEGQEIPEDLRVPLTVFLTFRTGDALGKRNVTLKVNSPTGKILFNQKFALEFAKNSTGSNLNLKVNFGIKEVGTYWFDVLIGQSLMTRIPLHVKFTSKDAPKKVEKSKPQKR